jgi:protein SCO1/2
MSSPHPHTRYDAAIAPRAIHLTALAVALAAVALALGGCSGGSSPASSSATGVSASSNPSSSSGFDGAALPVAPAHGFTLADVTDGGRAVSLSRYRGRVVVLAFLYSTCGAPCVVIAQQIRGALDELGAHSVPVLLVSADPAADSPARVRSFLAQVSLSGRARWLTGSLAQLRAVWRAYGITPPSAGQAVFANSASVFLLDSAGRERVLFQSEQLTPEGLAHDIHKLRSLP